MTSAVLRTSPGAAAHPTDAAFLTQFRSVRLPDGLPFGPANGNCGPTSIVNTLRLLGLDVPGFHGERSQAVIDAARRLATGSDDASRATLKTQQAFALRAAGAQVDVTRDFSAAVDAARHGAVVLLGGNRAAQGWPRRADDAPPVGVAGHAVVLAAVEGADAFRIDDPALPEPVTVTLAQLRNFTQADDANRMPRLALAARRATT